MTLALLFLRRHFRHLFHDCLLKLGLLRHELVHARIARMRVERVGLWPPPFIVVFATQDPFLALGSGVGIIGSSKLFTELAEFLLPSWQSARDRLVHVGALVLVGTLLRIAGSLRILTLLLLMIPRLLLLDSDGSDFRLNPGELINQFLGISRHVFVQAVVLVFHLDGDVAHQKPAHREGRHL